MFGDVVLKIPNYKFDHLLESIKEENNFTEDTQLSADHLRELVKKLSLIHI